MEKTIFYLESKKFKDEKGYTCFKAQDIYQIISHKLEYKDFLQMIKSLIVDSYDYVKIQQLDNNDYCLSLTIVRKLFRMLCVDSELQIYISLLIKKERLTMEIIALQYQIDDLLKARQYIADTGKYKNWALHTNMTSCKLALSLKKAKINEYCHKEMR